MKWMITGTSSGFGRALAVAARDAGHDVIATARDLDDIADLEGMRHERLDLAEPAAMRHHDVDVLVNNAGFGLLGAFEELTDAELRESFAVNLFGHLHLTRAVLPGMRQRGYGRIVQMSSVIGVTSGLGGTAYAGPKAALEAISVALAAEVKSFGIAVTIVQPGPFRTSFGGEKLRWAHARPAYEDLIGPPRAAFAAGHGRQPNDPAKGARAILAAVGQADPPLYLPLGPEAFDWIGAYLKTRLDALDATRALGGDTAY
jgi:short-subunit dehydrogenase